MSKGEFNSLIGFHFISVLTPRYDAPPAEVRNASSILAHRMQAEINPFHGSIVERLNARPITEKRRFESYWNYHFKCPSYIG